MEFFVTAPIFYSRVFLFFYFCVLFIFVFFFRHRFFQLFYGATQTDLVGLGYCASCSDSLISLPKLFDAGLQYEIIRTLYVCNVYVTPLTLIDNYLLYN